MATVYGELIRAIQKAIKMPNHQATYEHARRKKSQGFKRLLVCVPKDNPFLITISFFDKTTFDGEPKVVVWSNGRIRKEVTCLEETAWPAALQSLTMQLTLIAPKFDRFA